MIKPGRSAAAALAAVCMLAALDPAAAAAPASAIEWEESYAAAVEKAAAGQMPIMIAVNMDGEKVCEDLVEKHYREARVVELSRRMACLFASRYSHKGGDTACPRAPNITCAAHQQVEKDVRREVLGIPPGEDVIAPQHIFLGPDKKPLLSVEYIITPGELEWCMATAIRQVDPSFRWSFSGSARAPRRVVFGQIGPAPRPAGEGAPGGGAPGEGRAPAEPLTPKELEAVIAEIRKSGRGEQGDAVRRYFPSLIVTDHEDARKEVKTLLSSRWALRGRGAPLIHDIGRYSPPSFWEVVEPFLSATELEMRNEAAVALEQLAEPRSLKALQKQRSAEKEESVQGNLLRAIASAGRGNRSAESLVLKAAEKERNAFLRVNALVGLVHVEDREKVNGALVAALSDAAPGVRAAAAYTAAVRREIDMQEPLRVALDIEQDPKVKSYLRTAAAALEGGGLNLIEGVLREYALDTIPRDRE